jgi:hypothetical protein
MVETKFGGRGSHVPHEGFRESKLTVPTPSCVCDWSNFKAKRDSEQLLKVERVLKQGGMGDEYKCQNSHTILRHQRDNNRPCK